MAQILEGERVVISWLIDRPKKTTLLIAVGVAAGVNYLAWLGWDQKYTRGADGYQHGPYESWQVVGVVLVLGLLAFVVGWADRALSGAGIVTAVMALSFSIDVAGDSQNDGLWLVGAFLVAAGTFCGFSAAAAMFSALRHQMQRSMRWCPAPGWPEPPEGWRPTPGWLPDPSWPAAPADHRWWARLPRS